MKTLLILLMMLSMPGTLFAASETVGVPWEEFKMLAVSYKEPVKP